MSLWQENILKYCDSTLEILEQINTKIESDGRTKAWTRDRLYFLDKRIIEYNSSIEDLAVKLRKKTQDASFEYITEGLSETQEKIAEGFKSPTETLNKTSFLPLTAHIFAACFCMGCSALYHLCTVKNRNTSACLARLDYGGISILIYGSTIPISSYGMSCQEV